jgi:hypothetical protein
MHYAGASKQIATFVTFFVSAVLHELIFSVSFKTFRPWFFMGMLVQFPLILAGKFVKGTRAGNFVVWSSLFCGFPLLEVRIACCVRARKCARCVFVCVCVCVCVRVRARTRLCVVSTRRNT